MAQKRKTVRSVTNQRLLYPRELLAKLLRAGNFALRSPWRQTMSTILDTMFFASLQVEESEAVRVAVVYARGGAAELEATVDAHPIQDDPSPAWDVTRMPPIDLTAAGLAKFSRALEYGKQLAIIGGFGRTLRIEGIARRRRRTDGGNVTRIAAPRPGVLVFERGFRELFRFSAGLHVEPRLDVVGKAGPVRDAIARISGVRCGGEDFYTEAESALNRILPRVRAHGAGAIIAMLPTPPSEGLLSNIKYRRADPLVLASRISNEHKLQWAHISRRIATSGVRISKTQVRRLNNTRHEADEASDLLEAAIDDVARLSAVDGALVIGPRLSVYGAGYLIPLHDELPEIIAARDAAATETQRYEGSHGARHKAAFSFVCQHPGGIAFVFSEDGPVNCTMMVDERLVVWPVQLLET